MSPSWKLFFWAVVLFPVVGLGADAAIAVGSGNVKLNGKELVRSSAVFPGDEIRTEAGSGVVLNASGSTVQVGPAAVFSVRTGGLKLTSGSARVSGKLSLVIADITVNADLQNTNYMVTCGDGVVLVTAIKGSIQVLAGRNSVRVREGETRSFTDESVPFPKANTSRMRRSTTAGFAAGAGVGGVIASHLKDGSSGDVSSGRLGR